MTKPSILFLTAVMLPAGGLPGFAADSNKCIVTGDTLGGDNGPPVSVTYKGQTIKLCCKACVRKFNANPEKYLTPAPAPAPRKKSK
jgi:hypothetical protein